MITLINYALAAAIAACLSMAYLLDAPSEIEAMVATAAAVTDAQEQAARELRRDLAAARLCRELHGEAGYQWSAAGEVVCVPRRGKRQTQVAAL
jgi:hypothetical protein